MIRIQGLPSPMPYVMQCRIFNKDENSDKLIEECLDVPSKVDVMFTIQVILITYLEQNLLNFDPEDIKTEEWFLKRFEEDGQEE